MFVWWIFFSTKRHSFILWRFVNFLFLFKYFVKNIAVILIMCVCYSSLFILQFMEQEGPRALLEFWLAAHNFSSQLEAEGSSKNFEQAQSDAIVLYEKWVHCLILNHSMLSLDFFMGNWYVQFWKILMLYFLQILFSSSNMPSRF